MKIKSSSKTPLIKCPHCGSEYLPGEVYMPGSLIGQPDDVVRDSLGKLIYEDYDSPDREPNMIEHFTCEYITAMAFVYEAQYNSAKKCAKECKYVAQLMNDEFYIFK